MRLPDLIRRFPLPERLTGRPERVLLELDLGRRVGEAPPANPVEAIRSLRTPQLRVLVEHLRLAAHDDSVAGLIATVPGEGLTLAQSGELRTAVAAFRAAGKATLAWSPTFGELTPGMVGYHFASAFEEVWLQPSGLLGLVGFAAEPVFLRGLLDKLGVEPQFGQRYEYKSAADTFMRTGLTEPHREMLTRLLDSATATVLTDVAADRELDPGELRQALEQGPLDAAAALSRKLIDRIGYRDQAYAAIRERLLPGEPSLRFVERHGSGRWDSLLEQLPRPGNRPVIAVVSANGPIQLGHPRSGPGGGHQVTSESLGAALRAAGRDDQVKAVVLRIDSPGGSYVASDALRRDIARLRESGKPVVASMASVAASGGYFLAMPCDRIVANPGTITGSIGVLAGKFVLSGALEQIGLHRDTLAGARHAAMLSSNTPFDPEQLALLDRWLDQVYDDFTTKAAADRGLPLADLQAVAKGRVWTGADAADRGLVDTLGGLTDAVTIACDLVGIARADVTVTTYPKAGPLAALTPPENSEVAGGVDVAVAEGPGLWSRLVTEFGAATGLTVPGVLSLPPLRLPGLLPH